MGVSNKWGTYHAENILMVADFIPMKLGWYNHGVYIYIVLYNPFSDRLMCLKWFGVLFGQFGLDMARCRIC